MSTCLSWGGIDDEQNEEDQVCPQKHHSTQLPE